MAQQQSSAGIGAGADHPARNMSVGKGLLSLAGAVVVIGAFVALNYAMGVADTWVGFLFALYWAGLERSNFKRFPHCLLGAAAGLTAAFLLRELPLRFGSVALVPCLIGVMLLVYFQIMGWCAMVVNMTTMLFLAVATIPAVHASGQYPKQLIALAVGAGYFALVLWIVKELARRRAGAALNASPS